jgi:hypothetical protein
MAAAELAAVNALSNKAFELAAKVHMARSAEKYGAAAAAAQALGNADCLVTARLRVEEAAVLYSHSLTPGVTAADAAAARERALALLRTAALPTLQRRKAAGTLMAGACRPVEEAWNTARWRQMAVMYNEADPSGWAWTGAFAGYEAYLGAAVMALSLAQSPSAAGCHAELVRFAASAADLVAQPRIRNDIDFNAEVGYVEKLTHLDRGRIFTPDASAHELLLEAWRRLQRSGVLRARGIDHGVSMVGPVADAHKSEAAARDASAVLRGCALAGCAAREVHPAQFKKCAACQAAWYCCKEHQEQHWPAHKAACKAARRAAAEGGAGPSGGA